MSEAPDPRHPLAAQGIALEFAANCGFLCDLAIDDAGHRLSPMHRVPWQPDELPAGLPPHLARMQGDFFCAPFGDGGGTAEVPHGAPGNGHWSVDTAQSTAAQLVARLDEPVQGAALTKTLTLRDGHPFVYQAHRFDGGTGQISVANHAMVSLPQGGRMTCSPKASFRTPDRALEPDPARGRSALVYPASRPTPQAFPRADGGQVDLTTYPFVAGHEDMMIATEAEGHDLGWTAVVRKGFGEAYLSLRNARQLPMTILWHSDGGRDHAPWNGRHRGCLGVEEGHASHLLNEPGGIVLDGGCDIRHVTGAIRWPSEAAIAEIHIADGALVVCGEDGARREVPFHAPHLFP